MTLPTLHTQTKHTGYLQTYVQKIQELYLLYAGVDVNGDNVYPGQTTVLSAVANLMKEYANGGDISKNPIMRKQVGR